MASHIMDWPVQHRVDKEIIEGAAFPFRFTMFQSGRVIIDTSYEMAQEAYKLDLNYLLQELFELVGPVVEKFYDDRNQANLQSATILESELASVVQQMRVKSIEFEHLYQKTIRLAEQPKPVYEEPIDLHGLGVIHDLSRVQLKSMVV